MQFPCFSGRRRSIMLHSTQISLLRDYVLDRVCLERAGTDIPVTLCFDDYRLATYELSCG